MVNANKLKSFKNTLGQAPSETEASRNIFEPEAIVENKVRSLDGRRLRNSRRTVQLGTRVTPEFSEKIKRIADEDDMLIIEVLERALNYYEKVRSKSHK